MTEKTFVWPDGVKKTKPRVTVMSVLQSADKPLSAVEIMNQTQILGAPVWLSTVYRVLEQFIEKGVVMQVPVLLNQPVKYEIVAPHHKHYALCLKCQKVIEMENCPMSAFVPALSESGFTITDHNLVIYGYCKDCKPEK